MDARGLAAKVFPEYRRRGIITHVTFLQTCYLLDPVEQGGLGLVRVSWRCIPENKESAGAALKSGYTYEGTMRNYTVYPAGSKHKYARAIPDNTGRVVEDGMVFSLTIEDWITGGKREMMQKYLYLTQPKPAEVAAPAPTETETAAPAAPAAE
jgi:RimJ/RimL family protein N-acetyltransferase